MKSLNLKVLSKSSLLYLADESHNTQFVVNYLKQTFSSILLATNEENALSLYYEESPGFILTDINFPSTDIIKFIKNLREENKKLQIALTFSYDDMYKIIKVVEMNISKIMVKPLTSKDLGILVETFSKRHKIVEKYDLTSSWVFEPKTYTIKGPLHTYTLTKKESNFLSILFKNNKIITNLQMKEHLWEDCEINDNVIHTFIKNIRKKLPKRTLITVKGVGYKLSNDHEKVKT